MREGMGLYRGKSLDNGEWVEGNLLTAKDGAPDRDFAEILVKDKHGYGVMWYEVDMETIGQWTGLVDKNGVKVFEGDIVECWSEGVKAKGAVTQRIDGLWIIYPAWQENKMWGLCPNESGVADVEVIGNIHDKVVNKDG